jgi:hypothetical protein
VDEQTVGGNEHSGEKEWYEKLNIRGYAQLRINDTLWYDPDGAGPYHPDRPGRLHLGAELTQHLPWRV